jgi:transposase
MAKGIYWLNDVAWPRIEPLLPNGRRGAHRVDDRRIISGIVHTLKSGAWRRDWPSTIGPHTTVYSRFSRWSKQGVWEAIFRALAHIEKPVEMASADSTPSRFIVLQVAQRGFLQRHWPFTRRAHEQNLCADRSTEAAHIVMDNAFARSKILFKDISLIALTFRTVLTGCSAY